MHTAYAMDCMGRLTGRYVLSVGLASWPGVGATAAHRSLSPCLEVPDAHGGHGLCR